MEKKITCVIVPVGHPAHRAEVVPKLKELQRLVDGYIEIISLNDDFLLICDEEAKLNGKPGNRHVGGDIIAGQFVIVKAGSTNDFESLSDEEAQHMIQLFKDPETISPEEVEQNCWMNFFPFL